jgi:hypothetical protein
MSSAVGQNVLQPTSLNVLVLDASDNGRAFCDWVIAYSDEVNGRFRRSE